MGNERRHAVVLGGSMIGLAAARALASHFERVTVVERDVLPVDSEDQGRKGVPQGNHAHALLAAGLRELDRWFPGFTADLIARGGHEGDVTGNFLWHQFGAWKLHRDSGLRGVIVTRPVLEDALRARVRAIPNVTFVEGTSLEALLHDAAQGRVTGVRVRESGGDARELSADLIIDTTGRGSQTPKALADWGYGTVEESLVEIDVAYATHMFERRPGDLQGTFGGIFVNTPPASARGGAMFAMHGSRWLVGLWGSCGDHPPTQIEDFRAFSRTLPVPHVHDIIHDRAPLGPGYFYRFPANRRRHYEAMRRFPAGLVVMGDALCCFNPIYGQGMSVGILEAAALERLITLRADDQGVLGTLFFKAAKPIVDIPWSIAVGEDLRFPTVKGKRPPGMALLHRYMARAHRVAGHDVEVARTFFEVAHLVKQPTAMLSPAVALRVLRGPRAPDARA